MLLRLLMLNRNELSNLEFPGLPGGLISKPTLVWEAQSESAGKKALGLTYMTGGISWHAEYVLRLSSDEKSQDEE